jgi:hypothetical protein
MLEFFPAKWNYNFFLSMLSMCVAHPYGQILNINACLNTLHHGHPMVLCISWWGWLVKLGNCMWINNVILPIFLGWKWKTHTLGAKSNDNAKIYAFFCEKIYIRIMIQILLLYIC